MATSKNKKDKEKQSRKYDEFTKDVPDEQDTLKWDEKKADKANLKDYGPDPESIEARGGYEQLLKDKPYMLNLNKGGMVTANCGASMKPQQKSKR